MLRGITFFVLSCYRHASRSAPRAWQKDTNIAQLPNTYNGIYEELHLES